MGRGEVACSLLLLGLLLDWGCWAQLWSPSWRWTKAPRALSRVDAPLARPAAPLPRAAPRSSHAVKVACEPHRVVVSVHRDLFGVGKLVAPTDLTLGRPPCPPVSFDASANVVVFEAGLHECGSVVQMTPALLIYRTSLFYTPSLAAHPVILRTNAAEIPIECRYPRADNISSEAVQPTWVPFRSTAAAEARLGFSLRLMNGDWSAERTSTQFRLGEALRLQAEVLAGIPLPLRLFVESCAASLSLDTALEPRYAVVASSGCLVDGRQEGVSSMFLSPRPRQEALRFTIDAFRFAGDPRNLIYLTCRLKVTPAEQAPDALNKACSFNTESNAWIPVEGSGGICDCCETRSCGRTMGFGPGHQPVEMSWQRSLPAEMADPQADLVLGPLFIFGTPDSVGEFLEDPADAGNAGMEIEDFAPAIEPKAAVAGTRLPHKDQGGSANTSKDQKDKLALEGHSRRGPIFFGEVEDGSGSGEQANPAMPEEESAALELKAAVISRLPEDIATSSTERLPVEAVSTTAAKGAAQQPGAVLVLLLLTAGLAASVLALGVFVLMRRCHHHRGSALSPSPLGTKL